LKTLGLDLGASKLLARVVSAEGEVEKELRRPVHSHLDPEAFLALLTEIFEELEENESSRPAAVGLGFPGLVDPWHGLARSSVMLPGWSQEPIARRLQELCGMPCRIDNDVNNFARGELHLRAEANEDSEQDGNDTFLFVAIGSGIGGALVLGGEIWQGSTGLSGEIGHVSVDQNGPPCPCGSRGCVNLYASGPAIETRLGLKRGSLARGEHGDEEALQREIHQAAQSLGVALASAQNLLNLPLIVLGGGVAELGEGFRKEVELSLQQHAFSEVAAGTRVELAQGGYGGGALGAALLAREAL